MGRQLRRVVGLAVLAALTTAAVALAAGPKKGATYSGTIAHGKQPIVLKVAKNGKSVTVSVQVAPLYCEGGSGAERQLTKPVAIANDGSFSSSIVYEFVPTRKKTTRVEVRGKFSGKSVTGTVRSIFGLESLESARKLRKCDGSSSFGAKTR